MILIGQYDSPFVRRVAVALQHYALPYQHLPLSVWSDAEELGRYNPLRRVPVLVQDDGECLIESSAILDMLDQRAGAERALLPASGAARRLGLKICALACGVAEKAVSLFYESLLREQPSQVWSERCRRQIQDTLAVLEASRGRAPFCLGEALSHADIAVTCALRFVREAHSGLLEYGRYPALHALAERCEALPVFSAAVQPLTVNLRK